jgi:hypothetical protein
MWPNAKGSCRPSWRRTRSSELGPVVTCAKSKVQEGELTRQGEWSANVHEFVRYSIG